MIEQALVLLFGYEGERVYVCVDIQKKGLCCVNICFCIKTYKQKQIRTVASNAYNPCRDARSTCGIGDPLPINIRNTQQKRKYKLDNLHSGYPSTPRYSNMDRLGRHIERNSVGKNQGK
jgi:hypothetical protein